MPRYLDPKNDFIFKRVFGEHKNLCISLLNSLLPLDVPIASIEYLPIELVPDILDLKNSSVDVRCTDQKDRQFLVEMQMQWSETFKSRVLFNASKVYVRQLEKARKYELLQPVYSLNLISKEFDKATTEFYHHYKIVNIANTEQQIKGLEFVFVELPKFQPKNVSEKRLMVLWLRYLIEMDGLEKAPSELLEDKNLSEALHWLEASSYTKAELEAYEDAQDAELRESALSFDNFNEGKAIGLQEGEAERKELVKTIEAKDAALEAKDAALEAKDRENEVLKKQLEEMRKQMAEGRRS